MNFWGVWLKGFLDRKIGEAHVFSPQIHQISISPNFRENRKEK